MTYSWKPSQANSTLREGIEMKILLVKFGAMANAYKAALEKVDPQPVSLSKLLSKNQCKLLRGLRPGPRSKMASVLKNILINFREKIA
jgi:hypothetical protein